MNDGESMMGINVSLVDGKTLKESPLWDSGRYAGDRDFGRIAAINGTKNLKENHEYFDDFNPWRPVNVESFLESMPEDFPNPERFKDLAVLLSEDENLWVYESF